MTRVYLAGPLFTRGEMRDRINDERVLQKAFPKWKIFNPINLNKKKQIGNENLHLLRKSYFYEKDLEEIFRSNIMIADIDNNDPGTLVELGIYIGLKGKFPENKLYIISSNWKGDAIMNKFLLGAIDVEADYIAKDMNDLVKHLKSKGEK